MNGVLSYLPHRSVGGSMKSFSHRLVPEMRHSIEDTDSAVNDPAVGMLESGGCFLVSNVMLSPFADSLNQILYTSYKYNK